jgi:hypothetical protein
MDRPKTICPDCGAQMNHHAIKIDYSVDDPSIVDPAMGVKDLAQAEAEYPGKPQQRSVSSPQLNYRMQQMPTPASKPKSSDDQRARTTWLRC